MGKKNQSQIGKGEISELAKQMKILVAPRTEEQRVMMKTIAENIITFIDGPAGSGKTLMSIHYALQQLFGNKTERIIITRPVVEAAGEKMGYLPGDIHQKLDPYVLPVYQSLHKLVDDDVLKKLLGNNGNSIISTLPMAHMRGINLDSCITIGDECQNTLPEQIRMLITRIGEGSKIIICGDMSQSDIKCRNGLEDAFDILQGIDGIGFVTLTEESIVRHPIIRDIENRYRQQKETHRKKVKVA